MPEDKEARGIADQIINDPVFWVRLNNHMQQEEDRFASGDYRMDRIEEDLKPIKKLYNATIGASMVGALLLGTLLYIYHDDKGSLMAMQDAIYKQGIAIERLILSHSELEKDVRNDVARMERNIDRLHPSHK